MEFRKSIINYNELTRGYVHLGYSVKKIKILIVKSKMATVLKLSIFDFCDFWIAASDSVTCMHGFNFFHPTRPRPAFWSSNPAQLNTWIKNRNSVRISGPVLLGPISANQAKQPNKSIKYVTIIRHKNVHEVCHNNVTCTSNYCHNVIL